MTMTHDIVEPLAKIVARRARLSRRQAEGLIKKNKVALGAEVLPYPGERRPWSRHVLTIDGRKIPPRPLKHRYYLLYKPRHVMVTKKDPQGRKTVYELLPERMQDLKAVGRLDFDSEGLLLFTDDGDFANHLAHPRYGIKKTYRVRVRGEMTRGSLIKLAQGCVIDGKLRRPEHVALDHVSDSKTRSHTWIKITLVEGRHRQIHHLLQAAGYEVVRLIRMRQGPYELGPLAPGQGRVIKGLLRRLPEPHAPLSL